MQFIKKVFVLILICLLNTLTAQVKSIGTPFIQNYTRANYAAGSQTWDIEQGKNGMMYFANNNGLLEYDGKYWKVYPMPNNSIIRSIKSDGDSIMFAGGFNEFGYYIIGKMGGAEYHSLVDLLPADKRDFGDVWNIYIHPDGVIFQTYTQLIFLKNNHLTIIPAPTSFHFSFLINNEFYVNDLEEGLMRYAMGKLYPLMGMQRLKGKEIWGMQALDDKLLIATASEGVFIYDGNSLRPWKNQSLSFLEQNQIYCTMQINKDLFAFGTIQNGMLICDKNGIPLQHINMDDGLQNNTILCIEKDKLGNLWLGTDLGIDYIQINSPLSQLSHNYGLSTGYTTIVFKGNLYLGTNRGLFVKDLNSFYHGGTSSENFKLIEKMRGQVWTLQEIDDRLFCGHNNGTFIIEGENAQKISSMPGGWSYLQPPNEPDKIIGGNFSGFALYQKINNHWKFIKQFSGFSESSRTIAFDNDNTLWMAHGYKGVFHITFDRDYDSIIKVEYYNAQNSNLKSSDANLAKIDDQIIFTNLRNTYTFSAQDSSFVPDSKLNKYFDGNIRSLMQDKNGNIWYFMDNTSGVLRLLEDGNYSNISIPFQKINDKFVKGFEFVYPLDENNVFFGSENGFIHYNPSISKDYAYPFKAFIRTMRSFDPDSIYAISSKTGDQIELEYKNNDLEFVFSANDFENPGQIRYATYMQGYDEDWTDWQLKSTRDFTNLYEGEYIFKVRAKNIYGTVSDEISVAFTVLPPFQRTYLAYFIYGIIILITLILFVMIIKRRFERNRIRREQEQLDQFRKKEEALQREKVETEKELIRMRNEKLRAEMKQKDKELANSTMQTLQKNRLFITIRNELKKLSAVSNEDAYKHEVNHLVRKINREIDDENQWKVFETHFESVHEEFLKRLKTAYPDLSPRELKLCAYLRMNISSKEIAVLMNISTRGVEISRYRLRKKLGLTRDTNLTDFILSF